MSILGPCVADNRYMPIIGHLHYVLLSLHSVAAPCLVEMTAVMTCWKSNAFDDISCRKEIEEFIKCAEAAVSDYMYRCLLGCRNKIVCEIQTNTFPRQQVRLS